MIVVLLAAGCHPISRRPRANPACRAALQLALKSGQEVVGLHVGLADEPSLKDYLGLGLSRIITLEAAPEVMVQAICAKIATLAPRLIMAGDLAEAGEGSGMVPYLVAARLGWPEIAGVIALECEAVVQTRSSALHARLKLQGPAVLIVQAPARAVGAFAFGKARRGQITAEAFATQSAVKPSDLEVRPARRRPKLLSQGAAAQSVGKSVLTGLTAQDAAVKIYDFLQAKRLIGKG